MRLIDADGLLGILNDLAENGAESIKISGLVYLLNDMPARGGIPFDAPTDVVEVVRCKDCKYRGDLDCPMFRDVYVWRDGDYVEIDTTKDYGFCSEGERRGD
jgi:hypothetical protein